MSVRTLSNVSVFVPATQERIPAVMEDRHLSLAEFAGILSPTEVMLVAQALRFAGYEGQEFEDCWAWEILANKFSEAAKEAEASL